MCFVARSGGEEQRVDGLIQEAVATTFHGAFGDISFDRNGDVTKAPYVIWQVKDGKFVEMQ